MARPPGEQGLMPSLLDRLTDPELAGSSMLRGFSPTAMMTSIRRDLECLFNTHASSSGVSPAFVEVRSSVATFGMPDLASLTAIGKFRPEDIGSIIGEVIARFEPRLRDVRVVLTEPEGDVPSQLRFQVEARLNVDPSPDVAFETIFELTTGQASIRSGEGA